MKGDERMRQKMLVATCFVSLFLVGAISMVVPLVSAAGPVSWLHEDTVTKGNWYPTAAGSPIGVYGSYAYILPDPPYNTHEIPIGNFSVPVGGTAALTSPPYNWTVPQSNGLSDYRPDSPYWDEYVTQTPAVTYYINGTRMVIPTGLPIKYPAFEFAWGAPHSSQTEPREVYYPLKGMWILASWDDGGERSQPTHGYFNITMYFPSGSYMLSLYAYDFERIRTSETFNIYGSTGSVLYDSHQISGTTYQEGVYESSTVSAPPGGLTIIVQIYNDAGHPNPNLNVVLSGIFVDLTAPGENPPPQRSVGGEIIPVGTLAQLAPWIAAAVSASVIISSLALRKKKLINR